jgi:hypothetical protein
MYRLDLDDPRAVLPVPVYGLPDGGLGTRRELRPEDGSPPIAFFALERPVEGALAAGWAAPECADGARAVVAGDAVRDVLFFGLQTNDAPRYPGLEVRAVAGPGSAVMAVWPSPLTVRFPVGDYPAPLRADAGPDRCVAPGPGGFAEVALDGAASRLPQDAVGPVQWTWSWEGQEAQGMAAAASLAPGTHAVTLTVTLQDGRAGRDTALVHVTP